MTAHSTECCFVFKRKGTSACHHRPSERLGAQLAVRVGVDEHVSVSVGVAVPVGVAVKVGGAVRVVVEVALAVGHSAGGTTQIPRQRCLRRRVPIWGIGV